MNAYDLAPADIELLDQIRKDTRKPSLHELKIGESYINEDIMRMFLMHYTGMGLSGDQSIDYAQNKTLAESRTNGVGVHLFESFEPKEYIYRGQVQLVGDPYYERQKDEANNQRQVVKFPLRLSQQ